jgi:hypothetical protein
VFRKQGDIIQCTSLTETAEKLGEEKTFTLKEDFVLVEYLVREALIRFLQRKNVQFSRIYYPTTFILERENLVKEIVDDEEIACLIAMYPQYEIESRLIVPHNKDVIFGIQVNFSVCHIIEATVYDLLQRNVDVLNQYVTTNCEDTPDPRIAQKYSRRLAGKVVKIDGVTLKLTDYREHNEIDAQSCFLEPNQFNFRHCLDSLIPQNIDTFCLIFRI